MEGSCSEGTLTSSDGSGIRTPSRRMRAEGPVPVLAEVDVVVLGSGWECAADTDMPHEGGRRVVASAGSARHRKPGQERAVGDGKIGVGHDGIRIDDLTVEEPHPGDGTAGSLPQEDAVDPCAIAERGAGPLGGGRQRQRQRRACRPRGRTRR